MVLYIYLSSALLVLKGLDLSSRCSVDVLIIKRLLAQFSEPRNSFSVKQFLKLDLRRERRIRNQGFEPNEMADSGQSVGYPVDPKRTHSHECPS
jgi:hypothetical protein